MPDTTNNANTQPITNASPARTPHELYVHHLQNPNEPITDEDILNLKLDTGAVAKEHQVSVQEYTPSKEQPDDKDDNEKLATTSTEKSEDVTDEKKITTPYDVLGGS